MRGRRVLEFTNVTIARSEAVGGANWSEFAVEAAS